MPNVEYMADGDRVKTKNAAIASDDYVKDQYYFKRMGVSEGWPSAGVVLTADDEFVVAELRNNPFTDHVHWTFPRPEHWRKGTFKITVWIAADTAEVAKDIRAHFHLSAYKLGSATGDVENLSGADDQTVRLPSAADILQEVTVTSSTPVAFGEDFPILSFEFQRVASHAFDNYGGHIHLFGVTIEYRPSQSQ